MALRENFSELLYEDFIECLEEEDDDGRRYIISNEEARDIENILFNNTGIDISAIRAKPKYINLSNVKAITYAYAELNNKDINIFVAVRAAAKKYIEQGLKCNEVIAKINDVLTPTRFATLFHNQTHKCVEEIFGHKLDAESYIGNIPQYFSKEEKEKIKESIHYTYDEIIVHALIDAGYYFDQDENIGGKGFDGIIEDECRDVGIEY